MSFEISRRTKWLTAVFVVVFIGLLFWKFNALKASMSATVPASAKTQSPVTTQPATEVPQLPVLLPGETCDKATEALGEPQKQDEFVRTWREKDFTVYASVDSKCVLTSIAITVETGHKVRTADGVTLGMSTLANAERILRPRIKGDSESVEAPEGNWAAMISIGPAPDVPYKVTYRAALKQGAADQMSHDPVFDDFRNLPVSDYSLEMGAPSDPKM